LIKAHGADTVRLYTLFIGPPEKDAEWSDSGIEGAIRFLRKLWRRVYDNQSILNDARNTECVLDEMKGNERDLFRKMHETIEHVTRDMEGAFHFNAAIAQIMELANAIDAAKINSDSTDQQKAVYRKAVETVVLLISPFTPHIAEELWEILGYEPSILNAAWPVVDKDALVRDEIQYVIQINGKVKGRIMLPADSDREAIEKIAMEDDTTKKNIEGKTVRKVIVVPGRLVNIVVG
jgi:leucyl-tRNA synthetase